jgi:hypothetical protein
LNVITTGFSLYTVFISPFVQVVNITSQFLYALPSLWQVCRCRLLKYSAICRHPQHKSRLTESASVTSSGWRKDFVLFIRENPPPAHQASPPGYGRRLGLAFRPDLLCHYHRCMQACLENLRLICF